MTLEAEFLAAFRRVPDELKPIAQEAIRLLATLPSPQGIHAAMLLLTPQEGQARRDQ